MAIEPSTPGEVATTLPHLRGAFFRLEQDRLFLRSVGIRPAADLIGGRIRPWKDHPLFRFPSTPPGRRGGGHRSSA